MHVAIDARLVHYTRAGIGEYTLRLTRALAAAYPADRFTLLQDFRDASPAVTANNVAIAKSRVPSHHRSGAVLPAPGGEWTESRRLPQPGFYPAVACARPLGDHHSRPGIPDLSALPDQGIRACYYGQIDRAVRRADQIIAVSESTKNDLVRMLGVREDQISVIYEGADPHFQPIDHAEALQHVQALWDLPEEFILFVSTIEPRKNVGGLLRAYRRLRDDYKLTPTLVLVGAEGWLSEDIHALVDELKLRAVLLLPWPCQLARPALPLQRRALPGAPGVLRGLWPDTLGSDGLRHAGDCLQRLQSAGSGGRCSAVGGSAKR